MKWRICTHDTRPASAVEIDERMSVGDVVEAHVVLDAIDDARIRARAKVK